MRRAVLLSIVLLLPAGCGGEEPRAADSADPAARPAPAGSTRPADSLALTAPGGVTVWFTVAREAKDSAGTPCIERALEVRRDTVRAGVPLLYTREAPTLLDSAAMRAVLYNNCRAGPVYRVDFATVSPQRISP